MLHSVVYFVGHLLTPRGGYLEVDATQSRQLLSHLVLWNMALQEERMHHSMSDSTSQSGRTITGGSVHHLEHSIHNLDSSEDGLRGGRSTSCVLFLKRSLASATVPIDFVLWPT